MRGIKPRHELARPIQGYPPSPQHLGQRFIHFGGRGGPSRGRTAAVRCFERSNLREFGEFAEGGTRDAPQARL